MALAGRLLPGKMHEMFISISTHNGLMRMGMSYGRKTAFLFALRRKTRIARGLAVTAPAEPLSPGMMCERVLVILIFMHSTLMEMETYSGRKTVYPSALKLMHRIALALQRMAQVALLLSGRISAVTTQTSVPSVLTRMGNCCGQKMACSSVALLVRKVRLW